MLEGVLTLKALNKRKKRLTPQYNTILSLRLTNHRTQSLTFVTSKCDLDMEFAEGTRYTPGVGFFVFVMKWLNLLRFLCFRQFCGIAEFEELWSELDKPLGINRRHLPHVLFCCQNQLVIQHPGTKEIPINNTKILNTA